MPRWLEFALFENVYVVGLFAVVVGALIWGIFVALSTTLKLTRIGGIAAPMGIVAALLVFTMIPSQPRYNFERENEESIGNSPWTVVVERSQWGSFSEPRTLFDAPVGSYLVARPQPYGLYDDGNVDLIVSLIRYREDPVSWSVTTNCESSEASWQSLNPSGVSSNTNIEMKKMSPKERVAFCDTDWEPIHQLVMEQTFSESGEPIN